MCIYFFRLLFNYILNTGLDPAFPLYMFVNPSSRLSADAAEFVDIIHTDGGILGYPWPLGHADFYPNQGIPLQPGCAKQELSKNRWYSILGKLQKSKQTKNQNTEKQEKQNSTKKCAQIDCSSVTLFGFY